MSDTANTQTEQTQEQPHGAEGEQTQETPSIEDLLKKVEDLTAHSRKWEERAKANKDAKDALDELQRSKMTDEEKASADRTALEQRATDAEDRASKAEAALARFTIATEFGLSKEDAEALASISDETALRTLAERLAGRQTGPKPTPGQGRGSKPAPSSPKDAFVDALSDLF